MHLEDILRAVARLTAEERQQLRDYLGRVPEQSPLLSPEDRMQRLNAVFDALGDGLSPTELDSMTAAMTEEYSQPSEASAGEERF